MASRPEPPPKNEGRCVPEELKEWIRQSDFADDHKRNIIELIDQRNAYGLQKYGQPLMSQDGRNTVEDARQEAGDLLQYIYKAIMNGEDLSPIKEIMPFLYTLLYSVPVSLCQRTEKK